MSLQADKKLKMDAEKYLSNYFNKPDLKAGFQAYLYSYLYWKQHPEQDIIAGIYALKTMKEGIMYLRNKTILLTAFFEEYEKQLCEMLTEIFDQQQAFVQTEDEKRYSWSPYKGLVGLD